MFCSRRLGRNDAIEFFPVGRTLAFDSHRGRLWVICVHCSRWNLVPIEERWEAVEQCERLFRGAPIREATDHVSVASLSSGLRLVRIGAPPRAELAAWRYGRVLQRRYFASAGWRGVAALGLGSLVGGVVSGALSPLAAVLIIGTSVPLYFGYRRVDPVDSLSSIGDQRLLVRRFHLDEARIAVSAGARWTLLLPHSGGLQRIEGEHAPRALGRVLTVMNGRGGSEYSVARAVDFLSSDGTFLTNVIRGLHPRRETDEARHELLGTTFISSTSPGDLLLGDLTPIHRLALEIALHENVEERAMSGNLQQLEEAWREAEEVASIADDLLLPQVVRDRIAKWRG
jgi:hypothetical protein